MPIAWTVLGYIAIRNETANARVKYFSPAAGAWATREEADLAGGLEGGGATGLPEKKAAGS